MLGADLAFRPEYRRWLVPGALLSAVGLFATFQWHKTIAESCLGLGIAFLMAYLTQVRSSIGNKILGWKPLAWIGTFSYSIYLVHSYIEIAPARWLNLHTNIWAAMTSAEQAAFFVVTFPAILLLSYAFHIVFERPFMGIKRQRAEDRLTPTASADLPVHSRT
jgi:peptidoglycan/LPS O-acetylase OafA/YrhL